MGEKMKNSNQLKTFANQKQNKNAIIYTRTALYDPQSLKLQKQLCTKYCKQQGLNIAGFFGNKAESGSSSDKRTEFNKMLDFIDNNNPNVDYIIVYSHDRFSRSGDVAICKKLEKNGIKIKSVAQIKMTKEMLKNEKLTNVESKLNYSYLL